MAILGILWSIAAHAQLAVTLSPLKVIGQKVLVPLALENRLSQKVDSARAVVFLLDEQGKAVSQPTTRWVIGGTGGVQGLPPGRTNAFHFVLTAPKPISTTNLIAKVAFTRIVLEGEKLANPKKDVLITIKP